MHRSRATLVVLALVSVVFGASVALAEQRGAAVDKTGWWSSANVAVETAGGVVTVPPPPGVPPERIVVSDGGDEVVIIGAVGIQPEDPPGSTIDRFDLILREDPDADGNQGSTTAAMIACPITNFWAGGENGQWVDRPEHDCDLAEVGGVRKDDGTWTFDLRPIGALWFDPFGTLLADGVVLRPDPEGTTPYQIVFLTGDDIDIFLDTTPPPEQNDENPFIAPPPSDPPPDAGLNSGPSGGGGSLFSPPSIATPPTTSPTVDLGSVTVDDPGTGAVPDVTDPTSDGDAVAAPQVRQPVVNRSGELLGNFPGAIVLLVPLFLALLAATSYWLGPNGEPITTVRQRGVSRALDARRRSNKES